MSAEVSFVREVNNAYDIIQAMGYRLFVWLCLDGSLFRRLGW